MSAPATPALRMRSVAAASPPNPPPTICAFIGLLPGLRTASAIPMTRDLSRLYIIILPTLSAPGADMTAARRLQLFFPIKRRNGRLRVVVEKYDDCSPGQ